MNKQSIWETILSQPKKPFLITDAKQYSYADLSEAIKQSCAEFTHLKITPEDRIIIQEADPFITFSLFLAAFLEGIIPTILPSTTGEERIFSVANLLDAKLIFSNSLTEDDSSTLRIVPLRLNSATNRKSNFFSKFNKSASPLLNFKNGEQPPDCLRGKRTEVSHIQFTSGTTASPSGVTLSSRNLFAQLETMIRVFEYGETSRIFNPTPLAHADGLVHGAFIAAACGGTWVSPFSFETGKIENWLNLIRTTKTSHLMCNPTILSMIEQFGQHDDYFDSTQFKYIISSAGYLSPELWLKFEQRFNCKIYNIYGMSETVANALYAGNHAEFGKSGTLGKPVDCETRIISIDGVKAGGELQIKGDNVFMHYWGNEQRTKDVMTSDGWLKTGDIVEQLADGSYTLKGRLKSCIISGGTTIWPDEIDEALLSHQMVSESVTIGIKDSIFDEIAVSAVVRKTALEKEELFNHCRQLLDNLRIPKHIIFVDNIPRGVSGKPILADLKIVVEDHLQAKNTTDYSTNPNIADTIFEISADIFSENKSHLTAESNPASVTGWDSFSHINLIMQVEVEFDISISADQIIEIKSLANIIAITEGAKNGS